jgi:[ribosomal protein S5]-alanine N-acetyltransferase
MVVVLIRCDPDGKPTTPVAALPEELVVNCQLGAELFRRVGYVEPWVGYIAVLDDTPVGGGAFVGPPNDGCVEIAYYTLPQHQGRGIAGQIAAGLVAIARNRDPTIQIKAFTLMEENPSVRILRRLGFANIGTAQDADAGEVWEWRA